VTRTTGVFLLANYAEALIALGRWDEADARLAEAFRLDPPGTLALAALRLRARLRLARGHDGADRLVARALIFLGKPFLTVENRVNLLELRVLAALHAGDDASVRAAARAAVSETRAVELPRYGWPMVAAAATAADRLEDDDLRAQVTALAAAIPVQRAVDRAYAAQVAATVQRSLALWQQAVAEWRADGQRHPLGLALLGLAAAAAGAGDRSTAAAALEEAAGIADELGAAPMIEQATTLAQRLGLRFAARTVAAGTEVLTAREREVLRLVAEGHSNSRIAERLYISPKTASVHVSRIIAKLEVSNRVEAAAVARRLGLLDE
jgi:DNA-binding CsgD family transcriptional regulator